METYLIPIPKRAWKDSWQWLLNTKWGFIGAFVVGSMMGGIFVGDTVLLRALAGLGGGVAGIALIIVITYIVHLIITPIRQRNEAIALLSVKPKPSQLSNRDKLISAIHQVKETASEVISTSTLLSHLIKVDHGKTPPQQFVTNFSSAFEKYRKALSELECQTLIAGDAFHNPINSYFLMIQSCIQNPAPPIEQPNSTAVLLNDEKNTNKLNEAIDKVVSEIDRISQSASYKTGSQD